eukprot:scaffold126_cov129-Isochrysis_galbana.AAC.2
MPVISPPPPGPSPLPPLCSATAAHASGLMRRRGGRLAGDGTPWMNWSRSGTDIDRPAMPFGEEEDRGRAMFRGEGELLDPLLDRVRPAEETIWGWASCTAGKGSLRIARLCLDVEMPGRVGG